MPLAALHMILSSLYGQGMEVPLDGVTGDSQHYAWVRKSLGDVTGDSEHYLWIRNGGTIGCCYR